jgi:hypothetical protein
MDKEHEFRELLRRAQESVEPIRLFLDAVKRAPILKSEAALVKLVQAAESHARSLENELDEIWDVLKRVQ